MPRIILVRLLSIAVFAGAAAIPCYSQHSQRPTNFVIDTNREFVYLKLDHTGKGIQRSEDEPEMRLWLRFVNNCNVPIELRTFGVPEGSPPGEFGVMDEVVRDTPLRFVISDGDAPATINWPALESDSPSSHPEPATSSQTSKEPGEPPADYWFELGFLTTVLPGREILFSIPINQIGKRWHIQIPFEFKVPEGKVPRDPKIGGLPEMYLTYSLYDLPHDVQAKIKSQLH